MKKWMFIITGTLLMAVAYKTIYDSVGMVTGGFSGISIIVRRLTEYLKDYSYVKIQESSVPDGMQQGGVHIVYYLINNIIPSGGVPIWFTNISLNIPLFICAYKERGKAFLKDTLLADALLTVFMAVLPKTDISGSVYAWTALIGGLCAGTGIGMVLRAESTTGGTDMLASILYYRYGKWSIVTIMNVIDGMIIIAGVFLFGIKVTIWAVFAVIITTFAARFIIKRS